MKKQLFKWVIFIMCPLFSITAEAGNIWTQKSNFPGTARDYGTGFSIGHYGFIGCGFNGSSNFNDFYKWNQSTNTWSTIASYPGAGYRFSPIGFSVEGKGYVGLGGDLSNGGSSNDLWQYDTATNTWIQMASLPGTPRYDAAWFVIGHKVYVIGGSSGGPPYLGDTWVYDTHANSWTQLNSSPAPGIDGMAGFTIGNHGYVGGGGDGGGGSGQTNFWEYDTTNDSWTPIASYPGAGGIQSDARAFVLGSKAYLCTGGNGGTYTYPTVVPTGYVYDTVTKAWSVFADMNTLGIERCYSVAFSIGNYGYIGTGIGSSANYLNSLWQYGPADTSCALYANFTDTIGSNGQVVFTSTSLGSTSGTQYYWNTGDGSGVGNGSKFTYTYSYNGTYPVNLYITDSLGTCAADTTIYVTITNTLACALHANFTYSYGVNGEITFTNTSSGMDSATQSYWNLGDSIGSGYGSPFSYTYQKNGSYPVTLSLTNSVAGCTSDTTIMVSITNANNSSGICTLGVLLLSSKASCDTCGDGVASAVATSGTGPYSYHWSNGTTGTSIVAKPGIYTCCVTDANGCSACASTTISDSCLYAEYTYTVKYNTAGDTATIYFVSISDTICTDSTMSHRAMGQNKSISYTWNFGDGKTQTVSGIGIRTCTHSFAVGTYDVALAINRQGSPVRSVTTSQIKVGKAAPTGILSLSNSENLSIFPNPNNGLFRIAMNGIAGNQNARIEVINLLGEVLYSTSANSENGTIVKDISTGNISAGTYFVRIVTNNGVYVGKVLIAK